MDNLLPMGANTVKPSKVFQGPPSEPGRKNNHLAAVTYRNDRNNQAKAPLSFRGAMNGSRRDIHYDGDEGKKWARLPEEHACR